MSLPTANISLITPTGPLGLAATTAKVAIIGLLQICAHSSGVKSVLDAISHLLRKESAPFEAANQSRGRVMRRCSRVNRRGDHACVGLTRPGEVRRSQAQLDRSTARTS